MSASNLKTHNATEKLFNEKEIHLDVELLIKNKRPLQRMKKRFIFG